MNKYPMENKFKILKTLFKMAIPGVILLVIGTLLSESNISKIFMVAGFLFVVPFFIFIYVFVILHWKYRYKGTHSDLWGVLILIETSGFFKLIYMIRHILPDIMNKWRYSDEISK